MDLIPDFVRFLSFRGNKPPAHDGLFPLDARVSSRDKLAYLSMSGSFIRTASVSIQKGRVVVTDEESDSLSVGSSGLSHPLFNALKKKTNCGRVLVQIGELEHVHSLTGVRRNNATSELLGITHEAKSILGQDAGDHRHAMFSHPTANISVILSVNRTLIDSVLSRLSTMKLEAIRVQSSLLALLSVGLGDSRVASGAADLLILDHGSVTFIPITDLGAWHSIRHRRNSLNRPAETRNADLASLLEGNVQSGRPIVLIDTESHPPVDLSAFGCAPFSCEGYSATQLAAAVSCLDSSEPDQNLGIPNIIRGLGHELRDVDVEPSPLMPEWSRWAAAAFYIGLAAMIGGYGFALWQESSNRAAGARLQQQKTPLVSKIEQHKQAIANLKARSELARSLDQWLQQDSPSQPLMVELVRSFDSRARVNSISLQAVDIGNTGTRITATHRLGVTFSAPQPVVQVVVRDLKSAANRTGWEMNPQEHGQSQGFVNLNSLLRRTPAEKTDAKTRK